MLRSVYEELQLCSDCPLLGQTFVGDDGRPDSGVFVVGESPGIEEERTGRPFMGKAGSLLRTILDSMGWLEHVYFTNALHRRPVDDAGNTRKPTRKECMRCACHLDVAIAKHKPRYVITLGSIPLQIFDPTPDQRLRVNNIHGIPVHQVTKYGHGFEVIPTFQPSYVLKRGGIHSKIGDSWVSDLEDIFKRVSDGLG